jgi:hypothetical protein
MQSVEIGRIVERGLRDRFVSLAVFGVFSLVYTPLLSAHARAQLT